MLWLSKPASRETTTTPPLIVDKQQDDIRVWGGWKTTDGYPVPSTNTGNIRCQREQSRCSEAVATVLHHSEGEDLEVQMFYNQVARRNEKGIEAVAAGVMGEWLGQALLDQYARHDGCVEISPSKGMRR